MAITIAGQWHDGSVSRASVLSDVAIVAMYFQWFISANYKFFFNMAIYETNYRHLGISERETWTIYYDELNIKIVTQYNRDNWSNSEEKCDR